VESKISIEGMYARSEDVVTRKIAGKLLLVPIKSGIGNMEDELFNLNKTGIAIWESLDGQKSLRGIAESLSERFEAPVGIIEEETVGFVRELLRLDMIVEVTSSQ